MGLPLTVATGLSAGLVVSAVGPPLEHAASSASTANGNTLEIFIRYLIGLRLLLCELIRSQGFHGQRVYFGLEQRCQRIIDQAVTLQGFQSLKACGHDPQPEVPLAPGAGVARMRGTVVAYLQVRRLQLLLQQAFDVHGGRAWG